MGVLFIPCIFQTSENDCFFNAPTPRTHLENNAYDVWRVADSQTAKQFSAVASLFGLKLSDHFGVPAVIIKCSFLFRYDAGFRRIPEPERLPL